MAKYLTDEQRTQNSCEWMLDVVKFYTTFISKSNVTKMYNRALPIFVESHFPTARFCCATVAESTSQKLEKSWKNILTNLKTSFRINKYFLQIRGSVILNYRFGSERSIDYRTNPTWTFLWPLIKICCQIIEIYLKYWTFSEISWNLRGFDIYYGYWSGSRMPIIHK